MHFDWPYFDEGDRPPTLVEWAQDFCEKHRLLLRSANIRATNQSGFSGMILEEAEITVSMDGISRKMYGGLPDIDRGKSYPIIGLQGPGEISIRGVRHGESFYTDSHDIELQGVVTYA